VVSKWVIQFRVAYCVPTLFTHPMHPVMARDAMMKTLAASLLRYVERLLAVGVAVVVGDPPSSPAAVTSMFISAIKRNIISFLDYLEMFSWFIFSSKG
jgi:hypothetical protein